MKQHINLTIDLDVYLELKEQNAKISQIVNSFLKSYTKTKDDKTKSENELYSEYEKTQAKALKLKARADKVKADRIERDGTVRYID